MTPKTRFWGGERLNTLGIWKFNRNPLAPKSQYGEGTEIQHYQSKG